MKNKINKNLFYFLTITLIVMLAACAQPGAKKSGGGGDDTSPKISNDNFLFNLTISNGTLTPVFDSLTSIYTVTLAYSVGNVTVTPTKNNVYATIEINGTAVASGQASGSIHLPEGLTTTINIIVTAQDGTSKTYKIDVTRLAWDGMLADFNGINSTDCFTNNVGSSWWQGDDAGNGGNSTVGVAIEGPGQSGPWGFGYNYTLGNTWGGGEAPYVFIGTGLSNDGTDVDLSPHTGIKFYIKSGGVCTKQRVELVSSNITDWDYYGKDITFTADGNWHLVTIPFSGMTKLGFGTNTETLANSLLHSRVFQFRSNSGVVGEADTVLFDEIKIY